MLQAAESWAKNVYLPVVEVIRDLNVLKDFPDRTETDLYLWLKKHEWELKSNLGIDIATEAAAEDLTIRFGGRMLRRLVRLRRRFRNIFGKN